MIYVFLVLLAAVVAWRIILPGMRFGPQAGAGAAPAAPAAYRWISVTRMANIALIAAVVIISIWGVIYPAKWSDPSPADIGGWGQGRWFSILILWGIGAALIWLNASASAAKTLQTVLAGIVAAMLVIFPICGWVASQSAPARAEATRSATVCQNVNAEDTRECLVGSSWSNWIQFARGSRDDGKQICFSFGVQVARKDENGVTFWRYRVADGGTQVVKYRLFPPDVKCVDVVL